MQEKERVHPRQALLLCPLILFLAWPKFLLPSPELYGADYASRIAVIAAFLWLGGLALPTAQRKMGRGRAAVVAVATGLGVLVLSLGQELLPTPVEWLQISRFPEIESDAFRLFDLTVGLALVAVAEELAFRRVFLGVWQANGWRWMTLASCAAFGLLHAPQGLYAVVGTAMAGWLLMIAYRTSGTLWVPVALHYVINLLVFTRVFEGPA